MTDPVSPLPARGLDPESLVRILREQQRTFFGFFGAVVFAALLGSVLTTPRYRAVALIHLMPRAGQEMNTNEAVRSDDAGYMEGRDRARTQIQIILSRSIAEEVVRRYNALGNDDIPATEEGIDTLARSLSAGPREDTQLVEIAVLHRDPVRAATLANLVAVVYSEANLTARTDAARETQMWLEGQSANSRALVDEASGRVLAFKVANNLVDIDEKVDGITTRMSALQTALGAATTERVLLESKLNEHRRLLAAGQFAVLASMFQDPALDTMLTEHASLSTRIAEVLSRYGDQHPEHQRAVEHLKRIESLIATEAKRNVDGERSRMQTFQRQELEITAELDRVKAELLEKQRLQAEYSELKLDEDRARWLFGALGERGAEVDLQAHSRLNDVRLVDQARPPSRPSTPNLPLNLAVAIGVGVVGGLGLALLRNRLDETLLSTADVEHHLRLPLLGVILRLPSITKGRRALYSFDHPRSAPAETIRSIRAVLQTLVGTGRHRRLVVTSSLAGEGKTHSAVGLAVAFAQTGARVLLIDADLRLPQLHTLFGVPDHPGLADAVADADAGLGFVVPTAVPNLWLLPRGTAETYPNELLASAGMERVLVALGGVYDFVIIDTPPAALVSDALGLAPQADGVILVVRRGRVSPRVAAKTAATLKQVGGRVLGVVLNDVPRGRVYTSAYYDDSHRTQKPAAK